MYIFLSVHQLLHPLSIRACYRMDDLHSHCRVMDAEVASRALHSFGWQEIASYPMCCLEGLVKSVERVRRVCLFSQTQGYNAIPRLIRCLLDNVQSQIRFYEKQA